MTEKTSVLLQVRVFAFSGREQSTTSDKEASCMKKIKLVCILAIIGIMALGFVGFSGMIKI